MRIAGVTIPDDKRIEVALTAVYGIGDTNVQKVLDDAGLSPDVRTQDLTEDQVRDLMKAMDQFPIEGELRKEVRDNIQRLKRINSYRGIRHQQNLPVRGQQTQTNARTKRGSRQTVGAVRKQDRARINQTQAAKSKKEEE